MASNRKDQLPEWKLSKYDGNPFQWLKRIGQFRSAVDSQSTLSDDVKLTCLRTLVTGKAKVAKADFAYAGRIYRDALRVLERKLGQPQTVVSAHLKKPNSAPPVKKHNSENFLNFASVILSLVGVFRLLSYGDDLKGTAIFNKDVCKLPPNMKESWSSYTVKRNWYCHNLLDVNE